MSRFDRAAGDQRPIVEVGEPVMADAGLGGAVVDVGLGDVALDGGLDTPVPDRRVRESDEAAAVATPIAPVELTEAALEALLFVAERPLSRREIGAISGVDRATVDARLGDLEVSLLGRGIRLVGDGERVELATALEAGALIARYVGSDAVRLSAPSLETLAIVAYRQPVTKAVVERIRGVDSDYTIRALLHRRLIVELGRSEAPGRPYLYGTGFDFLERFGLTSLDGLPSLDAEIAARLVEETDEASASVPFRVDPDGAVAESPPPDGAAEGVRTDGVATDGG